MLDVSKIGVYILLFVPGFIWVQINDHYLARKPRAQLEHTLSIILVSSFIWLIAFSVLSFTRMPGHALAQRALSIMTQKKENLSPDSFSAAVNDLGAILLLTCLGSFVLANCWSLLRKHKSVERAFGFITGRTWHPSVSFQFFQENMDRTVILSVNKRTYLGTLYAAPDTEGDRHIILKNLFVFGTDEAGNHSSELIPMELVDQLLVKVDDISDIQAYEESIMRPRGQNIRRD